MKSKFNCNARTSAVTVSVRPAQARAGTTHMYELTGTRMHDVLEDGKWITKRAVPAGDVHKRADWALSFSVCPPGRAHSLFNMSNLLMLLIAAGGTSLCACSLQPQVHQTNVHPPIVVHPPKGEPGDFILCEDGRVLVFAVSHPKTCS